MIITSGANGALSSLTVGLVNEGDELVVFEPTFPMYLDHLEVANGVLKTVPLKNDAEGNWVFDS